MSKTIGIGMIGYSFMGKAHSIGYRDVDFIAGEGTPRPLLVVISGRDPVRLEEARGRYGWQRAESDWRVIVSDPNVALVDITAPNALHVEPAIAAVGAGKHVYCEKPLGPSADAALSMWAAADRAGVHHMCAFNYRFFPALQLARDLIQGGELGEIFHYRSNFLVSSSLDRARAKTWRDDKQAAGAGALGDLGAHHIDLSRFLLGSDPKTVQAVSKIAIPADAAGNRIETDDLFAAIMEFDNGAVGLFEASRVAGGHLVTSRVEVDGSKGSLAFSMQNLNELRVAGPDQAFKSIPVLREHDPFQANWFPPGHPLGWVDTFSHEAVHILGAIGGLHGVAPTGATFRDGYYCMEIIDTVLAASASGRRTDIAYRDPRR